MADIWVDTSPVGTNSHSGSEQEMYGLNGDDVIFATDNIGTFSRIYGGDGNDSLNYADITSQFAHIYGGDGDDSIDAGNNADSAYGDEGNDLISGADGKDLIFGGAGNDSLWGYYNVHDSPTDGDDEIYGGPGDDLLRGQVGNDILSGDSGRDSLAGGLGNDILEGGSGADTFLFDAILSGTSNVDTIKDFDAGLDKIALSQAIFFAAIGPSLSKGEFYHGNKAHDKSDRLIYNEKNGKLLYDDDGKGNHAKIQIALLDKHLDLHADDFIIVP